MPLLPYQVRMITIISGTNRPGSNTRKVAAKVETIYKTLDVEVQVLDLVELPPELFAPEAYGAKPASFTKFTDAVLASSGLVVVTPEYNGGLPGILKYFIDMLPFPASFEHRPVAFVGLAAGIWGALRPVEQLQGIFGYRNAYIYPDRVFISGVGKSISGTGEFANEEIEKRLLSQADGFKAFVTKIKGV